MMKKILLFKILFLICLFALAQNPTNFNLAIGKTFRKINDLDVFKNYIENEGVVISELKEQKKGFASIANGNHTMVLLTQYTEQGNKILAILDIGNIAKNERIILRECRTNMKKDNFIIAVLKPILSKAYFTNIRKAWRLDSKNNRFNPISVKSIDCLNEEFDNE